MGSDYRRLSQSFDGRYTILGLIGKGGMGQVYRAMPYDDPSKDVAIKIVEKKRRLKSSDYLRFQKEAALMSRLNHPHIVSFYELGIMQAEDAYYIVMEIAPGMDLKEILQEKGRQTIDFCLDLGIALSSALDYTHSKGIIHRDIKPQNIITDFRSIKILDFGVARASDGDDNDLAGTPLYMAPEQSRLFESKQRPDHRLDLYSLGCVLYECVVGYPPFYASSREKTEALHLRGVFEPLSHLRPEVPPIFEEIIHKLLQKDPDQRYQSAFSLRCDLLKLRQELDLGVAARQIDFALASMNSINVVPHRIAFVGRNDILEKMKASYEQTFKSRSRFFMVAADRGFGKTRLLNEFRLRNLQNKERVLSFRFSRHQSGLSFNAIANGFNEYLERVARTKPHEADEIRHRIKNLLGPTAHHLAEVIPGLLRFVPDIGIPLEDLSFELFSKAFSDFIRCLAHDDYALCFIVDDIHYADPKSLHLINEFLSHNNSLKLFFVASFNPSESKYNENFTSFIRKFSQLTRRFESHTLRKLNSLESLAMIQSMLTGRVQFSSEDMAFLYTLSEGCPALLFETIKQAVMDQKIVFDSERSQWTTRNLQGTELKLDSIDLCIRFIEKMSKDELHLFETASAIGMEFYENILHEVVPSKHNQSYLQKAVSLGLIAIKDVDDTTLGRQFSFNHWLIRQIFYERISDATSVHRRIAESFLKSTKFFQEKHTYNLAHHLNQGFHGDQAASLENAKQVVLANVRAGRRALEFNASSAAKTYFEHALAQIKSWPEMDKVNQKSLYISEKLGEINFTLKEYPAAMGYFREVLKTTVQIRRKCHAATQAVKTLLVTGHITHASKMFNSIYSDIFAKRLNLLFFIQSTFELFRYLIWPQKSLTYRYLHKAQFVKKSMQDQWASFLELGHILDYVQSKYSDLNLHFLAFLLLKDTQSSVAEILRTLAIRSWIYNRWGFRRTGFELMDYCLLIAQKRGLTSTHGCLLLLKCITMDYKTLRMDEIRRNVPQALKEIAEDKDRLWHALAFEKDLFLKLLNNETHELIAQGTAIAYRLPTRGWFAPRCVAMVMMAYMFSNKRDEMVLFGEQFVTRRQQSSGRADDPFMLIVRALLSFAKGEIDKVRDYYQKFVDVYLQECKRSKLWLFELDMMSLFAMVLPPLFALEQGRQLMRKAEMSDVYKKIRLGIKRIPGQNRSLLLLLRARLDEVEGQRNNLFKRYDVALSQLKVDQLPLGLSLCYIWFGRFLMSRGRYHRIDYFERAHELVKGQNMGALLDMMRKDRKSLPEVTTAEPVIKRIAVDVPVLSFVTHALKQDRSLEANVQDIFTLLSNHLELSRIALIIENADKKIFFSHNNESDPRVVEYLRPYIHLRSTLFLPLSDAPWLLGDEALVTEFGKDEQTLAAQMSSIREPSGDSGKKVKRIPMSAIVPLHDQNSHSIGLLFIEDIAFRMEDAASIRGELDHVGSLMAMCVESDQAKLSHYVSGQYALKACPWLKLWSEGSLRSGRESVWYYGQQVDADRYILFYCRINAQEALREKLGAALWYATMSMARLLVHRLSQEDCIEFVQEEFRRLLSQLDDVSQIDAISYAYTLFDRENMVTRSGQIGPSRPYVLGKHNVIKPRNDILFKLNSGRMVRYWQVMASVSGLHLYVLSHDASRFEVDDGDSVASIFEGVSLSAENQSLSHIFDRLDMKEKLPRYYVAALVLDQTEQQEDRDAS
jgi:serine/threonine protein kinase